MLRHASREETFSSGECDAAIRGQRVPDALSYRLTQLCVIRGTRYHPGFAAELRGLTPEFTRALNARSIMSDDIPEMNQDDDIPCCIWHPDVASEATYRELVLRYPQMKYHVARACAIAGYTDLYRELDVLPEVHVAEEARDNGCTDIFNIIMSSHTKYSVMDDYIRTVNLNKPAVSALNRLWRLRLGGRSHIHYFNITEDWCIYDHETESSNLDPKRDVSNILFTPLPTDLPARNKDVLILIAANYGDIDRYSRLRRPVIIAKEINCLMRGIYHNTLFARWWADQLSCAMTARYIMNSDLCRVTRTTLTHELPYCIWYLRTAGSRNTASNR
ncbi:hypothetical protein CONLIGDRAFT_658175 [Coniochaeta ligniaria NRRL 30616]|uniref:Uncharacterized protein n=1 Tax=Coniochaeta ligniaria NRRL 30616 TaxID=1408157 RepID=A0A1J7I587_9PEZI|nr:hypothetical protein CONLIGDRAFT_658175 [Coniochaeta ligniaria NRRL 30616]